MSSTPFVIDWPAAGRIAMMRRPDGDGVQLDGELAGLRALGVDTLVSALTDQDRARLGLMAEPDRAAAHGLAYQLISDDGFRVPNRNALISLGQELSREVRDGRFVVVHCHGGVGRSGLIVGATLVALGATPDAAMTTMATAAAIDAGDLATAGDAARPGRSLGPDGGEAGEIAGVFNPARPGLRPAADAVRGADDRARERRDRWNARWSPRHKIRPDRIVGKQEYAVQRRRQCLLGHPPSAGCQARIGGSIQGVRGLCRADRAPAGSRPAPAIHCDGAGSCVRFQRSPSQSSR